MNVEANESNVYRKANEKSLNKCFVIATFKSFFLSQVVSFLILKSRNGN